jgi:transcriptional regulator with XRE-family HTH domain
LGLGNNAEVSRLTGVNESLISKYRRGKARPTNETLEKIVSVIVPLGNRMGQPMDPVEFYVKFGLIRRDQLDQDPIDPLYIDLVQLDREAGMVDATDQDKLRNHIRILIQVTRQELDTKRAAKPGTGRKAG